MPREFVIQMKQHYPFGQLAGFITQDFKILVKKSLHYQNEQQFDMINSMVHFIKTAKHRHLVNISKVSQDKCKIQVYYEYAHLKLERWLININPNMIKQLQTQMIQLTKHLIRSGIRYQFDPCSIGLGRDFSIKYFLKQFSIDIQDQITNFIKIKQQIEQYFKVIDKKWRDEQQYVKNIEQICIKSSNIESIQTSWSLRSIDSILYLTKDSKCPLRKTHNINTIDEEQLTQKLESLKKKYLKAIDRLKRIIQK